MDFKRGDRVMITVGGTHYIGRIGTVQLVFGSHKVVIIFDGEAFGIPWNPKNLRKLTKLEKALK